MSIKGGAFFVKSSVSSAFLVKSLSKSESKALIALCPAYVKHLTANAGSLLGKLFGLFRVASSGRHFVVMENVLPFKPAVVYDMKGSTVHRRAKEGSSTLLDKNWQDDNRFVALSSSVRDAVMAQIVKDSQLLRAYDLMDYSLLVGVADKTPDMSLEAGGPHAVVSGDGESVFMLGIIDYLQVYNTKKKASHAVKVTNRPSFFVLFFLSLKGHRLSWRPIVFGSARFVCGSFCRIPPNASFVNRFWCLE